MVPIQVEYQGDLHCKTVHGPSGTELSTDAPKDNQGRGESFSPTDLVAAALGTCMLTIMGIMARTLELDIAGTAATVEKEMTATAPRMIQSLTVRIHVPHALSPENQQKLERAAHTAPCTRACTPTSRLPLEFHLGLASLHIRNTKGPTPTCAPFTFSLSTATAYSVTTILPTCAFDSR